MVAKVNTIDTSEIALKIKRDTDKSGLEKKVIDADKEIPDTTRLVKKKQIIVLKFLKQKVKYIVFLV